MNWAVTVGYNILYLSDHPKCKVAVLMTMLCISYNLLTFGSLVVVVIWLTMFNSQWCIFVKFLVKKIQQKLRQKSAAAALTFSRGGVT